MTSIQRYFMRSRPPPGEQITLNSSSSSSADDEDETEDSNEDTDSGTAEGVEQPTGVASEESSADTAIAGDPEVSASCPICMEPWTSSGKHRISCLPCGHLFGESCIRRWIKQGNSTRKCPQCNRKCKLNDIRKLYAEKLIVVDGEIMQEKDVLRTNNERLVLENRTLKTEKDSVTQERDTYLKEVEQLRSQNKQLIEEMHKLQQQQALTSTNMYEEYSNHSGSLYKRRRIGPEYLQAASDNGLLACGSTQFSGICIKPIFSLQSQSPLHGAKHFDIDAISQMTLISQKTSEIGSVHILRKMSLLVLAEGEQIFLPPETGAVRDIRIAPSGTVHSGRLALVAAKKLSIISFQSNNVSLTYELQIPAWSCAWDLNDSNQVYAGLQNGNLLVFDIRNTRTPLRSFEGLSTHPIHTLYSIAASSMQRSQIIERTVMGASVVGPSVFLVDGPPSKPSPVPGLEHSGVCISLAYNGMTNTAVASYRPKSGSHGNSSLTSPNSIFPSQYACSQAVIASQYCGTSTQVSNSPTQVANSPTTGYHYVLMQNGINNQNEEGNQTTISGGGETYCHGWKFNHDKVMHGNVSPWGISKSVLFPSFVPGSGSQHFFAHGDECKKAVSVFDLHSSSIMETLEPHEDKIIDIKHCTIGGKGVLGSVSENKLQIYTCQH